MDNEKRLSKLEFEQAETIKKLDRIIRIQDERASEFYKRCPLHEKQVSNDIEKAKTTLKNELMEIGSTYVYVTSFFVSILGVIGGYLYLDITDHIDVNAEYIIEIIDRMQQNKSD